VADDLDWSVPKALPEPAYQLFSAITGDEAGFDEEAAYYEQFPEG